MLTRCTIASFRKQLDCRSAPPLDGQLLKPPTRGLYWRGALPSTPILTTWPVACIIKYRVSRFKPHNYNSPPPSPSRGYCLARNFSVRDASGEMTRSARQIQINRARMAPRDERGKGEQMIKKKGILLFWWLRQRNRIMWPISIVNEIFLTFLGISSSEFWYFINWNNKYYDDEKCLYFEYILNKGII